MKILVTGKTSYAGSQLAKRIKDLNKGYEIDFVSVKNDLWKEMSFSSYDAIYHVAAIVHKKESVQNKDSYYLINRDLTFDLASKAKAEGVKSFVFLSTMAVYGLVGKIGKEIVINKQTELAPRTHYGKSKLQAEQLLLKLDSEKFKIAILRVPMIYGKGCPGNYRMLSKLSSKVAVYPYLNNKRSMIFIHHLSDYVLHIMEKRINGIILVKSPWDIDTLEMISEIRKTQGKKIYKSRLLGLLLKLFGNKFAVSKKMFGTIYYLDTDSNLNDFNYSNYDFIQSIRITEGSEKHIE
jgi:nucleoside-diphosphate-sugar epimerase